MSNEAHALLVVAGTFLPVAGLGATFIAAAVLNGVWRWTVLIVGPALTNLVCWSFAEPVMRDGNMLAAVTFIILYLFLWIYYPVLAIAGAVIWFRRKRPIEPA